MDLSRFWDWLGRRSGFPCFPRATANSLRHSAPSWASWLHILRRRGDIGRWGRWRWSTRCHRWFPVVFEQKRGESGQNSRPIRIKLSTRSVLRLHHHEVSKLAARRVNIKVYVSLGGYALLNVAAFFTKLANLAQEHTNLGGKSLAKFV